MESLLFFLSDKTPFGTFHKYIRKLYG